jgi:signal transduction histidine kinase
MSRPAYLSLLSIVLICRAVSQPSLVLSDRSVVYRLDGHLSCTLEERRSRMPGEMMADSMRSRFISMGSGAPHFGITTKTLWCRFVIVDSCTSPREWLLIHEYPITQDVRLYIRGPDGGIAEQRTGADVPFAERPLTHRKLVLPLVVQPGGTTECYLRITTATTMACPLKVMTDTALAREEQSDYLIIGAFYGILFVMFLYNVFLFISLREPAYLAYCFYILCMVAYQGFIDGTLAQFVLPHAAWLYQGALSGAWILIASTLAFAASYLRLRTWLPAMDRIIVGAAALACLMTLFPLIGTNQLSNLLVNTFGLLVTVSMLGIGIVGVMRGNRPARYFVFAYAGFCLGFYSRVFRNLGWLPMNDLTFLSMQAGILWDLVWLSLGLADRVRQVREEEHVQRDDLRRQIASDLHDDIASTLSSIHVSTQMVKRRAELSERDRRALDGAGDAARVAAETMRDIVWFINPASESGNELIAKMQEAAAAILAGMQHTFTVGPGVDLQDLDLSGRRAMYLIMKEALNNVVRHADAEHCAIELTRSAEGLVLTIRDDGVGFDPEAASGGIGLSSMRMRAGRLGAILKIDSGIGIGSEVCLVVPYGGMRVPRLRDAEAQSNE